MNPKKTRLAAVAGRFYPEHTDQLRQEVENLLRLVLPRRGTSAKAIIAPHAGYVYSGPIAASAFARFQPDREIIHRIVLLGPSHRVALEGLALPSAEVFTTPLGDIPVDTAMVQRLTTLPGIKMLDIAHSLEHALEVELPFLQVILPEFSIIPFVTGKASPDMVADVIEATWGGDETRFVISSDLSHYYDWQSATRLDRRTAEAIESLNPQSIADEQACGCVAIRGMLLAARRKGLHASTLDLRNSGDTAGPRHQVVGYGAFEFAT